MTPLLWAQKQYSLLKLMDFTDFKTNQITENWRSSVYFDLFIFLFYISLIKQVAYNGFNFLCFWHSNFCHNYLIYVSNKQESKRWSEFGSLKNRPEAPNQRTSFQMQRCAIACYYRMPYSTSLMLFIIFCKVFLNSIKAKKIQLISH
jgi:hypothetical protein